MQLLDVQRRLGKQNSKHDRRRHHIDQPIDTGLGRIRIAIQDNLQLPANDRRAIARLEARLHVTQHIAAGR
ncbi:hypothetical protein D3C84_1242360 [compost metagenome]